MKKTMFAVLCLAMTTITCVANNNEKPIKGHDNHPRMEMADAVINMEVVSQMGLSEKQMHKIADLKEKKHQEMKAMMPKPEGKPEGMHAKVQDINKKYRKEMQDIMGTKTYVKYLEKVNDQLAMHKGNGSHHKKGHGKMQKHQEMQHQPQGQHLPEKNQI